MYARMQLFIHVCMHACRQMDICDLHTHMHTLVIMNTGELSNAYTHAFMSASIHMH